MSKTEDKITLAAALAGAVIAGGITYYNMEPRPLPPEEKRTYDVLTVMRECSKSSDPKLCNSYRNRSNLNYLMMRKRGEANYNSNKRFQYFFTIVAGIGGGIVGGGMASAGIASANIMKRRRSKSLDV